MTRGSDYSMSLSKTDLLALSPVVESSYFSNAANWKEISLVYRSVGGNQFETVLFGVNNQIIQDGIFSVSLKSRMEFKAVAVTIHDFDGGYLDILRVNIPEAEDMDINLAVTTEGLVHISNFHSDAVVVGRLLGKDPLTSVGQSFTMGISDTLMGVQIKAKKATIESGSMVMKVYQSNGVLLATSANIVSLNDIGTMFTETLFSFNQAIVTGSYYFRVTLASAPDQSIAFAGTIDNPYPNGTLWASDHSWPTHDLDFKVLVEATSAPAN